MVIYAAREKGELNNIKIKIIISIRQIQLPRVFSFHFLHTIIVNWTLKAADKNAVKNRYLIANLIDTKSIFEARK